MTVQDEHDQPQPMVNKQTGEEQGPEQELPPQQHVTSNEEETTVVAVAEQEPEPEPEPEPEQTKEEQEQESSINREEQPPQMPEPQEAHNREEQPTQPMQEEPTTSSTTQASQEPQLSEQPQDSEVSEAANNDTVAQGTSPVQKHSPSPSSHKVKKLLENTKFKCQSLASRIKQLFSRAESQSKIAPEATISPAEALEELILMDNSSSSNSHCTITPTNTSMTTPQQDRNNDICQRALLLYSDYESQKTNFHAKLLLLYYLAIIQLKEQEKTEESQESSEKDKVAQVKKQLEQLLNERWNMSIDEYVINSIVGQVIQTHQYWQQMMNRKMMENNTDSQQQYWKQMRKSIALAIEDVKSSSSNSACCDANNNNNRNRVIVADNAIVPCQCSAQVQVQEMDPTSVVFQVAEDGQIFVNIVDNTKSCA